LSNKRRLVVVQAAGLGFDLLGQHGIDVLHGLRFRAMAAPFPGLTCPVQATLRTGLPHGRHGVPANGLWFGDLRRPLFWEQSSRLVDGPRVWAGLRGRGGRVALLFWQQSLGEEADILLSPMPVHKHHGGIIDSVYGRPPDLYGRLCEGVGRRFRLSRYWGPMASPAASRWIAEATAALIRGPDAPELCLTYLPALDYDLQRYGPGTRQCAGAVASLAEDIRTIVEAAGDAAEVVVFGDYAVGAVAPGGAIGINAVLRKAGWFRTRAVRGMLYPDLHASSAFAVADHEVAFVHVDGGGSLADEVAAALEATPGVGRVMRPPDLDAAGLRHARGGDLLAIAGPGRWFAYQWWGPSESGPDYAAHVDIHNKPGYDPCELFWGWPPFTVGRDPGRIRGSHGRAGVDRRVALGATSGLDMTGVESIPALAGWLRQWCTGAHGKSDL
jgi:hypothetical protein